MAAAHTFMPRLAAGLRPTTASTSTATSALMMPLSGMVSSRAALVSPTTTTLARTMMLSSRSMPLSSALRVCSPGKVGLRTAATSSFSTLSALRRPATSSTTSTSILSAVKTNSSAWQPLASFKRFASSAATLSEAASSSSSPSSGTSATSVNTTSAETKSSSTSSTRLASKPIVALHLYALAFLVYAIVVVGGLTRLTESGLSITEWNPGFKGMRLPMTTAEWESEWDKYKQTPEFMLLNSKMSLDDFKSIYMWEWGHRVLGRVIGVAFVLPAAFFVTRRWVAPGTRWKLLAIAAGIGFQGFLGWFMVKSGLSVPENERSKVGREKLVEVPVSGSGGSGEVGTSVVPTSSAQTLVATADWTPRVSHFRLAMHMGTAFLVYLAMLHTGLAVQRDYKAFTLNGGSISGVRPRTSAALQQLANTLNHPLLRRHSRLTKFVAGLVFTTAMSGALVAGLDAGLVYNEFPTMGEGRIAPPMHELMDDRFAQSQDGSDKVWRNLTQNPVTVQLIHRTLAITTALTVLGLAWKTHRLSSTYANLVKTSSHSTAAAGAGAGAGSVTSMLLPVMPKRVVQLANASIVVVGAQVTLGITTLIYMVPIPLASAHQAGSLALLSVLVGLISALRPIPKRILQQGLHRNSKILDKVLKNNVHSPSPSPSATARASPTSV